MKTIIKIIVAAIVAMGMAVVLIMHGASGNTVLSVYFFGAIGICAVLGVFDIKDRKQSRYDSIRHKMGYRKAA